MPVYVLAGPVEWLFLRCVFSVLCYPIPRIIHY